MVMRWSVLALSASVGILLAHGLPSTAIALSCDGRTTFNYGSGCGSLSLNRFKVRPGGQISATISTGGCTWISASASYATTSITVDGTPMTGGTGSAGTYSWVPVPDPTPSTSYINLPNTNGAHTIVYNIASGN